MAKEIDCRNRQGVLSYLYYSAKERAKVHPEIADNYQSLIDNFPHFESKEEVFKYVHEKENETHSYYRIFAKIDKDEEFYFIQNYYIAVAGDEVEIIKAAEYIGMEMIYCTNNM